MGQKVNPVGMRVGINRGWASNWFQNPKLVPSLVKEDYIIREHLNKFYREKKIEIAQIGIERLKSSDKTGVQDRVIITITGLKIGLILGKGAEENTKNLSAYLSKKLGKKVEIIVLETGRKRFYQTAQLVAQQMAIKLEARGSYRKVQKDALNAIMKEGQAVGCKTEVSGRLNGQEIARSEHYSRGRVPLHTLKADVDYAIEHALTSYGILGVKVWIYNGDILPGRMREDIISKELAKIQNRTNTGGPNRPRTNNNNNNKSNFGQNNDGKPQEPRVKKEQASIFDRSKKHTGSEEGGK